MMGKKKETVMKLAQTALLAALCFVSFTFLQIKIPMPGGDATSLHIGNAFCVLAALLLGGVYGGLAGAIGMTIADILGSDLHCRSAEDFCIEIVYRTDCRIGSTSDRKDQ